jgi:purine-nucleoside phosphorylase
VPTPHISAPDGAFAPIVLMPGDPRRARRIAQEFFDDPVLVTEVRSIEGWTGTWEGRPVSVLASGMGMPSISIYATELFRFYDVRKIIRVGTAGGMADELQLGDVVIGSAAHTDSSLSALRIPGVHYSAVPDFELLEAAVVAARAAGGMRYRVGPLFSSDSFYADRPDVTAGLLAHGTLAVEMEAAALYGVAAQEHRQALAVATVTDHILRGEKMSADDRETRFADMVGIALRALVDTP